MINFRKAQQLLWLDSVADHGRALSLLEKNGLITLKEGIDKTTATTKDIVENKKNLKFDADYEAALLPKNI